MNKQNGWIGGVGVESQPDFFNRLLAEDSAQVPQEEQQVTRFFKLITQSTWDQVQSFNWVIH